MNKVQQINLGGVPFTIDEDAYEHLRRYLETIHRHFRESDGYEEITNDIEARLAELFQEGLGNRKIVTISDVKNAIVIMGTPEDFGAEPIVEEERAKERQYRPGRRLFRDPEEEIIGGVCAGIAAYLGINDPLWIRLAFILLTITSGFGIPAYLILWAIVPQAKTASDRLAMRGEPINVSTIGKIVEEEVEHFSQKVSELGGKKKGEEAKAASEGSRILREVVAFIGKILRAIIDIFGKLWKPLLLLIGAALILGFVLAWTAVVSGGIFFWPHLEYFFPEHSWLAVLGAFNLLIVIGMLLLSVALSITRLLYGTRMSQPWRAGLTGFWVLNVISFFFVLSMVLRDFSHEADIERQVPLSSWSSDTLSLEMGADYDGESLLDFDGLVLTDDGLICRDFDFRIYRGETEDFEFTQFLESRGPDSDAAEELASTLAYEALKLGNTLVLPPYFRIPEGAKWRAQEVDLELRVPVGKFIRLKGDTRFFIRDADKVAHRPRLYDNPGSTWEMTPDGLQCLDCKEE